MMKRFLLAFASLILSAPLFSQTALPYQPSIPSTGNSEKETKSVPAKGGSLEVFWSEDFSNGFDGQGDNGQWTTDGQQAEYWFHTFPVGAENGYDPEAPIAEYGDILPNYFGTRDVVSSPSRDNGVIMFDDESELPAPGCTF